MRIEYKRMLISMIAIALFLSSGGVNVSAINIPVATTYYTAEKPLTPSGLPLPEEPQPEASALCLVSENISS